MRGAIVSLILWGLIALASLVVGGAIGSLVGFTVTLFTPKALTIGVVVGVVVAGWVGVFMLGFLYVNNMAVLAFFPAMVVLEGVTSAAAAVKRWKEAFSEYLFGPPLTPAEQDEVRIRVLAYLEQNHDPTADDLSIIHRFYIGQVVSERRTNSADGQVQDMTV